MKRPVHRPCRRRAPRLIFGAVPEHLHDFISIGKTEGRNRSSHLTKNSRMKRLDDVGGGVEHPYAAALPMTRRRRPTSSTRATDRRFAEKALGAELVFRRARIDDRSLYDGERSRKTSSTMQNERSRSVGSRKSRRLRPPSAPSTPSVPKRP